MKTKPFHTLAGNGSVCHACVLFFHCRTVLIRIFAAAKAGQNINSVSCRDIPAFSPWDKISI